MQMQALAPDQIWTNGRFHTLDAHNTIAQAVAVKNGRFLTVGHTPEIEVMAGEQVSSVPAPNSWRAIYCQHQR